MAQELGQDWHRDHQHPGTYRNCQSFFCRTVKKVIRWSQRTQARRGFDASGRTRRR